MTAGTKGVCSSAAFSVVFAPIHNTSADVWSAVDRYLAAAGKDSAADRGYISDTGIGFDIVNLRCARICL